MLEQIMDYVHNYFVRGIHKGRFAIRDGVLDCNFLQDGQYFKIVGSIFNDGVHVYPSDLLRDEVFCGEVWAMAVPPAFIALAEDIQNWVDQYGSVALSPYSSESFGGYSYTKASGSGAYGQSEPGATWQSIFANRLIHWRKII